MEKDYNQGGRHEQVEGLLVSRLKKKELKSWEGNRAGSPWEKAYLVPQKRSFSAEKPQL